MDRRRTRPHRHLEPLKHATLVIRDLCGSALWSAHTPRAGWTHELLQQEADRRRPFNGNGANAYLSSHRIGSTEA